MITQPQHRLTSAFLSGPERGPTKRPGVAESRCRGQRSDMMAACHAGCCFTKTHVFAAAAAARGEAVRWCDSRVCVSLSTEGEFEVKCVCLESQKSVHLFKEGGF